MSWATPCAGTAPRRATPRASKPLIGALWVLMEVWATPRNQAVFQVCTMLTMRAFGQAIEHHPMPGHNAAAELSTFKREQRLKDSCEPIESR